MKIKITKVSEGKRRGEIMLYKDSYSIERCSIKSGSWSGGNLSFLPNLSLK
jgi:hypothetical protein